MAVCYGKACFGYTFNILSNHAYALHLVFLNQHKIVLCKNPSWRKSNPFFTNSDSMDSPYLIQTLAFILFDNEM